MIDSHDAFAFARDFDASLTRDLGTAFRDPTMRKAAVFLSGPFAPVVFAPFLAFTLVRGGLRGVRIALGTLALGALTSTIATLLIKPLVARPVPVGEGFGFPDPPAATAFAIAIYIALFYIGSGSWNILLAVAIAAATIVAGVAFPSDAFAGAILGFVLAVLAWNATRNNLGRREYRAMTSELSGRQASKMSRR